MDLFFIHVCIMHASKWSEDICIINHITYVHSASELGDTLIRTWVKDRDHRYMCIINVCIQVVRRYMHDMYIYHAMAHGYKDHGNMNHTHVHHISTGTRIKAKNQEQ